MTGAPETRPCRNPTCRRPVQVGRAIQGYGWQCAVERGLVGATVDVGQDGPDLLDMLADMASARSGAEYAPGRADLLQQPRDDS